MTVATNSTIECFGTNTIGSNGAGVAIVAHSIVINAGGTVDADGQGYIDDSGPGAGITGNAEAGGGYGGQGGTALGGGGGAYGSATQPVDLGSAGSTGSGGGASGGGAIKMVAAGTLQMDGLISAGGLTSADGDSGGSGGSVWLQAGLFSGIGAIQADGAEGYFNGGGGGRIAVDYQTNTFTGTIIASGGAHDGGAGTVVLQPVIVLSNPAWLGNAQFQFQFNTFSGTNYSIQDSTNLIDWTTFLQVAGTGAPATIIDTNSGTPCRFYRVIFGSP